MNGPRLRCWWCGDDPLYTAYHDSEWGVPLHDDQKLFEMLILEGFQAGLSWITILRKRDHFRTAFREFDPEQVARFDNHDLARLQQNPAIVRNRLKIAAARTNARSFLELQSQFGSFDRYLWRFTNSRTLFSPVPVTRSTIRATSPQSDMLSKDLKKRGFSFVGSTIMYAFMQAVGMVQDHTRDCFRWKELGGE